MTLLKDIVQIEKGRKYNLLEENQEGAIRVFQANDFRNENKPLYTFDKDGVLAQEDDIMLVWDGSVGQMGFGRSGYVGSTMVKLKVKNKKQFSPFFIYRFLQTKAEYLKRKATGATIMHINRKSLEQLEIPDLEIDDQLHIANLLSKAENLIAQRKEGIAMLDEFLKSTFLEMFGDPAINNKKWEKTELKNFGKIITGNTPSRKQPENYSPAHIEWIKTDNIEENKTIITQASECLSEKGLQKARQVKKGALLVACIAGSIESVGRAAITDRTVSFNQQINAIQPSKNFAPLYLYWLFKIGKKYIQNHATKGMKKILTKGEFEKIQMIKPPLHLQTQFAQIVEKTEALKAQYRQSLQELENLYGSLSQRAFKGELRLNEKEEGLLMAAEPEPQYQAQSQLPIPPNKKGFAKLVLAGKIINECKDSPEFTNIKFQKLQHLAEHLMEADLNLNYYNQAAGPYDNKFMHTLHNKMNQQKWFASRGYKYSPLEKSNEIDGHFSRYFGNDNEQFSKLIKLLGKASEDQCEIISTLFAVWNDRIIKKEPITNEAIIQDFFNWSDRKQKYTSRQLTKAIEWMKENGLEPKGFGELIKHAKNKMKNNGYDSLTNNQWEKQSY